MADAAVTDSVFDDKARFVLALLVLAQFVALIVYSVYSHTPIPDEQLVLGAEISFVSVVLGYFFGSSSGSNAKTKLLAEKVP